MKYIIFGILALNIFFFSNCSQKYNIEEDFNVIVINEGKSIEIIEYVGTSPEVNIPPRIQKLLVTDIGNNAFFNKNITNIIIPNNVNKIGNYAFANNKIKNVSIPKKVNHIGEGAFSDNLLTNVTINNNVTYIGKMAFAWNQLTSFNIPNKITRIEELTFAWNQLSDITIPNSVTHIEKWAFTRNQLTCLSIPNSVVFIGNGAFRNNQLDHTNLDPSRREIYAFQTASDDIQRLIELARENENLPAEFSFLIPIAKNNYRNLNNDFDAKFTIRSLLEAFASRREFFEALETYYLNDLQKNAILLDNVTLGSNVMLDSLPVFDDELDVFIRNNRIRAGNYYFNNGLWIIK